MYYRKYFAGSAEDSMLTRKLVVISNSSTASEYYVRSDVICRAIQETLEDVGISCIYDNQNSTIMIEDLTIQISTYNNSANVLYNINGLSVGTQTKHPFNGSNHNYKFYVTLKGDIDAILNISIGSYSTPQDETNGISIGKGKDMKDGQSIRTVCTIPTVSNGNCYVVKDDEIFQDYKSLIAFGGSISNVSSLNGNATEVTLVECVAKPGRFKLDNCYFGNDALTIYEFYNIGGEIYYKIANNILVKCVDKKISSDIVIRRGTAPTLEISAKGIDVTELESVCITLSQYRKEITKSMEDMTIDETENILYVSLSQEDTLTLAKGYVHLQLQAVTKSGLEVASGIKLVSVEEI